MNAKHYRAFYANEKNPNILEKVTHEFYFACYQFLDLAFKVFEVWCL